MTDLLSRLEGGDLRSIGEADVIAKEVLASPEHFPEIMAGLTHADRRVRMRCADIAEKVTACVPRLLQPFADTLLKLAQTARDPEMRWHLAQMLPRLTVDVKTSRALTTLLFKYLDDDSRIVQVCALQSLAEMAKSDPALRERLAPLIRRLATTAQGALRARARKLKHIFD